MNKNNVIKDVSRSRIVTQNSGDPLLRHRLVFANAPSCNTTNLNFHISIGRVTSQFLLG
jgi:hypothetical protein